jgi:hypothetical protein
LLPVKHAIDGAVGPPNIPLIAPRLSYTDLLALHLLSELREFVTLICDVSYSGGRRVFARIASKGQARLHTR